MVFGLSSGQPRKLSEFTSDHLPSFVIYHSQARKNRTLSAGDFPLRAATEMKIRGVSLRY
jgi:hypothetical protein